MSMIERFKKLINNEFLKSNGILFIANITNGLVNFGIIFFAQFSLGDRESFNLWIAIGGALAVFQGPISGLSTHLVRKIANLDHDNRGQLFSYYNQFRILIFKIVGVLVIVSPLLGLLINFVFNYNDFLSSFLIIGYISFQFLLSTNQQLLLGRLKVWRFTFSMLTYAITRLTLTVGLVLVGFGVPTLPLAMLVAAVIAFSFGEWLSMPILAEIKSDEVYKFEPIKEFASTFWTGVILQLMLIFMNLGVLTGKSFLSETDLYGYSIAFTFGQVIHFGASSALGTFVSHSARKHNRGLYLYTLGVMVSISLTLSIFVVSAISIGKGLLEKIGKPDYFDNLQYIIMMMAFICFYNIIYVTIQYLLSRSAFKKATALLVFVVIQFIVLFGFNAYGLDSTWLTLWVNLICAMLAAGTLFYLAYNWKIQKSPVNDAIDLTI
jgi:hypothetical protein